MKKIYSIIALMLLSITFAMAQQNDKPTVCIDDFEYGRRISSKWANILRSNVAKGILETGRLNVIDVADVNEPTDSEQSFLAGLSNDNIEVLIKGNFNILDCKSERKAGKFNYNAKVGYTLTLVDTRNGNVIATHNFEGESSSGDKESDCIAKAIESATLRRMRKFVEDNFKVEAYIKEIDEIDKKGAKTVYVTMGSNDGIQQSQMFDVYQEIEVAGEVGSRLIGTAKAKEVLGGNLTLCTITKGGAEIKHAFDRGLKLIVVTRAKKGLFGDV